MPLQTMAAHHPETRAFHKTHLSNAEMVKIIEKRHKLGEKMEPLLEEFHIPRATFYE